MSTRERWIVYPLLFLTLGIAMRDKFTGRLRIGQVICDRLETGQSECRALIVRGANGRPAVAAFADAKSNNGAIATFAADGMPLVQIESAGAAAMVVLTGHVGQEFGIFAQVPELGGRRVPMPVPWRYDGNQAGNPPAGGAKATPPPTKQPPKKPDKAAETKTGTNDKEGGK